MIQKNVALEIESSYGHQIQIIDEKFIFYESISNHENCKSQNLNICKYVF